MDAAELACASLVVDATGDLIEACGCVLETSRGSLRASHIPYSGDLLTPRARAQRRRRGGQPAASVASGEGVI